MILFISFPLPHTITHKHTQVFSKMASSDFYQKWLNSIIKVGLDYTSIDPIHLTFKFNEKFGKKTKFMSIDDLNDYDLKKDEEESEKEYEVSSEEYEKLNLIDWNTIIFHPKQLTLSRDSNNKHATAYGGATMNKHVDFTIESEDGIKVKDLMTGVYRLKACKFDNYHEMFINAIIVSQDDDKVHLQLEFEYGS